MNLNPKLKGYSGKKFWKSSLPTFVILLVMALCVRVAFADEVIVNNPCSYFKISPATLTGSGYVYVDLISKCYTGDINIALGYDREDINPTQAQYNDPYITYDTVEYFCNGTFDYVVSPNYFWCYEGEDIVFEHSFLGGNPDTGYAWWNDTIINEWRHLPINSNVINWEFDNKNTWRYAPNFYVEEDQLYTLRVYMEVPHSHYSMPPTLKDVKYDFIFWLSQYGNDLQGAYDNNHLEIIDPWINGTNVDSAWTFTGLNNVSNSKTSSVFALNNNQSTDSCSDRFGNANEAMCFTSANADMIWWNDTIDVTTDYTISMWVLDEYVQTYGTAWTSTQNGIVGAIAIGHVNTVNFSATDNSAGIIAQLPDIRYGWTQIVAVADYIGGTVINYTFYVNGTYYSFKNTAVNNQQSTYPLFGRLYSNFAQASYYFNGSIDDVNFWYGTLLNSSEILELFQNESVEATKNYDYWLDTSGVDNPPSIVNLVSPTNETWINISTEEFICNATDDINLNNSYLYTNVSGSWQIDYTNSTSGVFNETSHFLSGLTNNTYLWNCQFCDNASQCSFATDNFTLNIGINGTVGATAEEAETAALIEFYWVVLTAGLWIIFIVLYFFTRGESGNRVGVFNLIQMIFGVALTLLILQNDRGVLIPIGIIGLSVGIFLYYAFKDA